MSKDEQHSPGDHCSDTSIIVSFERDAEGRIYRLLQLLHTHVIYGETIIWGDIFEFNVFPNTRDGQKNWMHSTVGG